MQKHTLLILFTGLSLTSFSQTITVRDKSTREPLKDVVIQDKNNSQIKTDARGKANISTLLKNDSAFVYQFGYSAKKIKVIPNELEATQHILKQSGPDDLYILCSHELITDVSKLLKDIIKQES